VSQHASKARRYNCREREGITKRLPGPQGTSGYPSGGGMVHQRRRIGQCEDGALISRERFLGSARG
jgi:hypothetical protein